MADEKAFANGYVDIWVIPQIGVADLESPTAAEINAGIRITPAIAWEGTTFPALTESNDIDDRSLEDKGNSTTRGFAQAEALLNFFRPKDPQENVSDYGKAFQFFRTPRIPVIIVTRVLQREPGVHVPAAAGQWISVFKMMTDTVNDDTEGEDSYKYAVAMLPQGEFYAYTQVKNAGPITLTPTTLAVGVGASKTVRATLGGKRATQTVHWSSSNTAVATVSQNGVVTGVSAGTANITATHPAATGSTTATVVTVS